MKITFLNQHGANRGDHAAFISQIDYVVETFKDLEEVNIIYNATNNPYPFESEKIDIKHYVDLKHGLITKLLFRIISVVPKLAFLAKFDKYLRDIYFIIKDSDLIYLSNGGANIGTYKDWRYLCRLVLAVGLNANIKSFGNSCNSSGSKLFDTASKKVLKRFVKYCSRDEKTNNFLKVNEIDHVETLDIVFIKAKSLLLKSEMLNTVGGDYIVFVPNEVYKWHPEFLNRNDLFEVYLDMIKTIVNFGYNIVMLPQLFGDNHINDYDFFCSLKNKSKYKDKIHVAAEETCPQDQIEIIKNSRFCIGGRYHSIVFSIITGKPFVSLSYEDKMDGMLSKLNLLDLNIPISEFTIEKLNNRIVDIEENYSNVEERVKYSSIQANSIVIEAMKN